jgi:pimeloyl-ACP methyl ester carboxylesterase
VNGHDPVTLPCNSGVHVGDVGGGGLDGVLRLRDGRELAWREEGDLQGVPVLRLQGMPGSRMSGVVQEPMWRELGLRVIKADRPGYGRSTRLPGRGIAAVADDLVELLDHLGLDRVPVVGASAGGPHVLALCALHPRRITSATVVVGAVPLQESDLAGMVDLNVEAWRRARAGDWDGVHALSVEQRDRILPDPLAGFRQIMVKAPPEDQEIMNDPQWQQGLVTDVREALHQGAEGWADEGFAVSRPWDFRIEDVAIPVVWWHARDDANSPLSAVERLIARMPTVDLRLWDHAGHLEAFRREREVLTELMERSETPAARPSPEVHTRP